MASITGPGELSPVPEPYSTSSDRRRKQSAAKTRLPRTGITEASETRKHGGRRQAGEAAADDAIQISLA